jgi:protein-tyrosine-phosphatase
MAHWLLEKKLKELKREDIKVFSCGTFAETGDGPTNEAINVMKNFDVDLTGHRSINIKNSSIREMDLILCATNGHKLQVLSMYPEVEGRVYTLKEYVGYNKEYHKKIDLDDPWGYGDDVYRFCANEINECLDLLLKKI